MACLPGDSVYCVLVGDVWFNDDTLQSVTKQQDFTEYLQTKRAPALNEAFDADEFDDKAVRSYLGESNDRTRIVHLRILLTTSTQMVDCTRFKPGASNNAGLPEGAKHLTGGSRMGLALTNDFGARNPPSTQTKPPPPSPRRFQNSEFPSKK